MQVHFVPTAQERPGQHGDAVTVLWVHQCAVHV